MSMHAPPHLLELEAPLIWHFLIGCRRMPRSKGSVINTPPALAELNGNLSHWLSTNPLPLPGWLGLLGRGGWKELHLTQSQLLLEAEAHRLILLQD